MTPNEKRDWAIGMLCKKSNELNRIPKKDDFEELDRSRIKAILGPWPRALEAAGLKPVSLKSQKVKSGKNRKIRKRS